VAWEGLNLNSVRFFLTTLGVIIGVAAVIIMLAVSAGAEAEIADQMVVDVYTQVGPAVVCITAPQPVPAEIVGADPGSDLAVLKIDVKAADLTVAELGESATLRVGQRAIAIGNPFGLEWTITTGVIISLQRTLPCDDSDLQLAELIQTDAAINPGNSGGPLLDSKGRVIGVNMAIASDSGTNSGVGFAIPVDIVKRVMPELIARGRYRHT
jgi:S1-C subfamily serine protease